MSGRGTRQRVTRTMQRIALGDLYYVIEDIQRAFNLLVALPGSNAIPRKAFAYVDG